MIDFGLYEKPIVVDEFEEALQELDILFSTSNTELIGNPDYGMNFEKFLWELIPSTSALEKYITEKISTCTTYMANMKYDLNVKVLDDVSDSIYVVNIDIYSNDSIKESKQYYLKQIQ